MTPPVALGTIDPEWRAVTVGVVPVTPLERLIRPWLELAAPPVLGRRPSSREPTGQAEEG